MASFVCISYAEEICISLPAFEGDYEYCSSRGPCVFDLDTSLISVSAIRVAVVGIHTPGWWDGYDSVDHYHGPRGGRLYLAVDYPNNSRWYLTHGFGVTPGGYSEVFTITNTLYPHSGDWSFLSDGISDFFVENQSIPAMGADGGFTVPPQISIISVALHIEAERNITITHLSTNGIVSWSPAYTQGVTSIETTDNPTGHWERIASSGASNTTIDLELTPGNTRFIRAVFSK